MEFGLQPVQPRSSQQKVRKSSTRADDIVRRRGYSDHLVTMYVCIYIYVCVCVCGCMLARYNENP